MNLATDGVLDIANNGQDRYKSITAELNFGSTNLAAVGDMLVLEILFSEGPFNQFSISDLGDTPFERLDFVQFHSPGNKSLGVVGTVIGSVQVEFLDVVGTIDNLDASNDCKITLNNNATPDADRCEAPEPGNWGDLTDSTLLFGGLKFKFTSTAADLTFDRTRFQFRADDITLVPEPAAAALFGLGLAGIGYQRRRQVSS